MYIKIDEKTINGIKEFQNNQKTMYEGIEISIVSYGWGPIYGLSLANIKKESTIIKLNGIKFIINEILSDLIIGFEIEKKCNIYEVMPIYKD